MCWLLSLSSEPFPEVDTEEISEEELYVLIGVSNICLSSVIHDNNFPVFSMSCEREREREDGLMDGWMY